MLYKDTTNDFTTRKRAFIALIVFLCFAVILVINILRLALINYDAYKDKAFDQITTTSPLRAERGSIYDANMNLLATTSTTWRIFISTKDIKTKTKRTGIDYAAIIAKGVSEALSLDYDTLYNKISKSNVLDVTLKRNATEDEYKRTLEFVNENGLASLVFFEAQSARLYPSGTLAAHVLGFTGSDNQGLYGLEYYYDSMLRGTDGYYLYAKDAGGNAMPGGYTTVVDATDGNSLVTTIDTYIQSTLEGVLEEIRINHDVTNRVAGIVMNTNTGAILGMATTSPFDPNSPYELNEVYLNELASSGLSEGSEEYKALKTELMQEMWSNKCISETYEPGSTFKILTVASALDAGVVTLNDHFSCTGYHTVVLWHLIRQPPTV